MEARKDSDEVFLGFTRYQWFVLFAAWLGWGFDVFDALLFNYVARLCIPSLLGSEHNNPQAITQWTGILTSLLLVGWAIGGIAFGKVTDRIGRSRALLFTMLTYAVATAACAFAPNIWVLLVFRFIASLGIGGEWAAGAALVAESVPESKRVKAGALLYTAAPAGLFLATFVTDFFTRGFDLIARDPDLSWRVVFLTGLIPAFIALGIRVKLKEPEKWSKSESRASIAELFSAPYRRRTIGGLTMASIALVTWWSVNAFLPVTASFLVHDLSPVPTGPEASVVKARFITIGTTWFNIGGLIGTLLTIPFANRLGRLGMFKIYFLFSGLSIAVVYGFSLPPEIRLQLMFFVGLAVFGVFGSFTFYLPELFPTRLRGTGSGFCYNTGRFVTALGPFIVGGIAKHAETSQQILQIVSGVSIVPIVGVALLFLGVGEETKGRPLE